MPDGADPSKAVNGQPSPTRTDEAFVPWINIYAGWYDIRVFTQRDPGAAEEPGKQRKMAFNFDAFRFKSQHIPS